MDEDSFLSCDPLDLAKAHIFIWGLGLMGGSLALALKGKSAGLSAADRDPQVVQAALERGIVDAAAADPAELLPKADVIVLSAPVGAILKMIAELPALHPGPALVMDVGSTKRAVVERLNRLPSRFEALGAHPMCGKEKGALENAEAGLFSGAPFALVRTRRTTQRAADFFEALARCIDARPLWVTAPAHDREVAITSHAPYLLAAALALATPKGARKLIGPGWRSAARLASTSPEMMFDILQTNRENVRQALRDFQEALKQFDQLLEGEDYDGLAALMREAKARKEGLSA